jgi:ribose/xylose/arabinose/galactoside ABC-type transport system permease subunit
MQANIDVTQSNTRFQKILDPLKRIYSTIPVSGQILSLLLVAVIFAVGTGGQYLKWNNIQTIMSLAGIPIIICLGIHQVIIMGAMDLSVEGIIALCVVLSGILIKNTTNNFDVGWWIFPIVFIVGGFAGMINGFINTKLRMPSFISTLGMSWALFGLAIVISGGKSIPLKDPRFQQLFNGSFLGLPAIFIMAIALFVPLYFLQKNTRFGKHLYAIGGDEILARQAGVNVDRIKIIVFAITGAIYGIAALLLAARLNSSAARLGNNILFPAMTAVAVGGVSLSGGIGGALNAVLGTLIVTALNNGLVYMEVSPYIQSAVNGLVLISAVALTIDRKKIGIIK